MTEADQELQAAQATQEPSRKKGKTKKKNSYGAIAAKRNKADKLLVLVFEAEGGAPYTVEVAPKKGQFELPNQAMSYKITRGSVWIENGTARTCVNAGNPQTVNIHTLTGNDVMHPTSYNADINNNLAEQVARIAKTKPIWARGTTWGIIGSAVVMGLLMFWLIKTVGSGFEDLGNAIENMKLAAENQTASRPVTPAEQGGHNNIAPEA